MKELMVSVSGIRGIVGSALTPISLVKYLSAFHEIIKGHSVVIGRDTRVTGDMMSRFVSSYMNALGYDVIDLGIASTPTVEINVTRFGADCGIILTASHNPEQWNALKLLNSKGEFLNSEDIDRLIDAADNNVEVEYSDYKFMGSYEKKIDANEYHINEILNLDYINVEHIKSLDLKIGIDTVNGVGRDILRELFSKFDFKLFEVNCEPNGRFSRGAEPTPENLSELSKLVKNNSCDIGFAFDPDGDRLAIVDEKGVPIGEEYTLAFVADFVLNHKKGSVATNLSSSMVLDDVAKNHGEECFRSKVGEINVSTIMKEKKCVVGGEGNGGVIIPELHYGRDATVGVVFVLQYMYEKKKNVSQIRHEFNNYVILKEKFELKSNLEKNELLNKFEEYFSGSKFDKLDGIKVISNDYWIHLRASNTEPIMRIMIESEDKMFNQNKYLEIKEMLGV